jgi:protein-S-isoprenylcysteine O-methyltransferase Ste14
MTQIILFALATIVLITVSWRPLRERQSHGFYRFFAWEALLALILLNIPSWFRNPFSVLQIISWLLLFGSIFMAVHGFWLLKQVGKPQPAHENVSPEFSANYAFENTSTLVTIGAYRYIRHPLYSSLLLLGMGAYLKDVSIFTTFLLAVEIIFLYLTARIEEKENLVRFQESYVEYMKGTRLFIPFLF